MAFLVIAYERDGEAYQVKEFHSSELIAIGGSISEIG